MWKLLQIAMIGLLVWLVYAYLGQVHWLLPLGLLLAATLNAATVWMIRARPRRLAKWCSRRVIDPYVRAICFFTGDVPPAERDSGLAPRQLLLQSTKDFEVAAARAQQIVRGHDHVIDGVMLSLRDNHHLRKRRRGSGNPSGPFASFLLVGGEGVGRRYLTRVLAKLLFRDGAVDAIPCDRLTIEGIAGGESDLIRGLRQQPSRVILLEQIERASADVQQLITQLLSTGMLHVSQSEEQVSLASSVIVLTTATAASELAALDARELAENVWSERAIEILGSESSIDTRLLGSLGAVFHLAEPSDQTKAEVTSLLMQKECSTHGVELSHVDPEILATQVIQWNEAHGFEPAPRASGSCCDDH